MPRSATLAVLALLAVWALPAQAWGPDGHRIVGEIAWSRMSPEARTMARGWMPDASYAGLAETADWADSVARGRSDLQWALELHYVNIRPDSSSYLASRDCPQGRCVVAALHRYRDELLRARSGDATVDPVEALRFLSHFVGDLHQPLHVAHPDGKGGNRSFVLFYGEVQNLHRVWDSGWLEKAIAGLPRGRRNWKGYVRHLLESEGDPAPATAFDPERWANESLAIAREWAFEPPESVGPADLPAVRPLIDRLLLDAGLRLAALLNEIAAQPDRQPGRSVAPSAAPRLILSDDQAAGHVGRTATVCGRVQQAVYRADVRGRPTFLNFGGRHPDQSFTAVIWGEDRERFDRPELRYAEREICVEGTIRLHRRKPQVVVSDPGSIVETGAPGRVPKSPAS